MQVMILALAVMVKNEKPLVERLIRSVVGRVDEVIVLDTGSVDGTLEEFRRVCSLFHLPYRIKETVWRDFAHGRTMLMNFCEESEAEFLLLADADVTFAFGEDYRKDDFTEDRYLVGFSGPEFYRKELLVRNHRGWRYVGRTHEFLFSKIPGDAASVPLDTIVATHHGDGGSRFDKYERDERLLLQDWEDPEMRDERPRTAFYLGQTSECISDFEQAAHWYGLRASMGGWEEERWVAQYRSAKALGDLTGCLDAWSCRPWRIEALYAAAICAASTNSWHLVEMFARHALFMDSTSNMVESDVLFVDKWIYDYGMFVILVAALKKLGRDEEAANGEKICLASPESEDFLRKSYEYYGLALY